MKKSVSKTSEQVLNSQLDALRAVFPQFVKEDTIDFDALKAFFDEQHVSSGMEKYGLNWAGKSNAFRAFRTLATGTLTPQPEESKEWDKTENVFIEGDNLEVLKLLQKHYREKIKMIYIDPPYNTGKDFVYKDNFTQGVADYYEQTGQTQGGVKMMANTEKNGRYHSDWLTMMYPRLFLAKNLLREDGVIFISIDDNEVHNLRLIMDEIFGEENFVAQIIWQKKYSPQNDATYFSEMHDYIICYAKLVKENKNTSIGFDLNLLERTEEQNARYTNSDNDPRGPWKSSDMLAKTYAKIYDYPIMISSEKYIHPPVGRCWRFSREKVEELIRDGRVYFGKNGDSIPSLKRFLSEVQQGIVPSTIFFRDEVGDNQEATVELKNIFDGIIFDTPKPVRLIKRLISLSTTNNKNEIILDFFAGSGTTAHAVMDLNAEDGGNRKWICVQLPETTDEESEAYKAGYKTIAEISRERIRRAGEKIGKGDVGFKSYKLSASNYRVWNTVTDEETLLEQSKLFVEHPLVDEYDERSVVFEILVKEGFDLNASVVQEKGDLSLWVVTDGDKKLVVTFAKKVTKEQVEKLKLSASDTFVCFDSALDDTGKVNVGRVGNVKTI